MGQAEAHEQLRAIALRWIDVLNTGELQAFDGLVAPDVVDHSGFSRVHGQGREGIKRLVRELRRVMPDWTSQVDEIQVRDDRVTIRHTGSGTPPPPFRGRPGQPDRAGRPAPLWAPRKVQLQLVSTIRVERGVIVEHWARGNP